MADINGSWCGGWQYAGINNDCLANLIELNAACEGFRGVTDSIYKAGNDTINAVHTSQVDVNNNVRNAGSASVEAATRAGFSAVEASRNVGRDVLQGFGDTRKDVCDAVGHISVQLCDVRKEISEVGAKLSSEICDVRKDIGEVKYAVALSTKEILLENQKAEARTREEMLKGFHQTQLDACKNTQLLQTQLAECCCEQKALTIAENARTRELLLASEARAKEVEIGNLKLQIALLGQNKGNGN